MKHIRATACLFSLAFLATARADEITGVQPASLDQPRIFMQVRRTSNGPALAVKVDKEQTAAIEAFLDTGASGVVIADSTAKGLNIDSQKTPRGEAVTYEDVGVAGAEQFKVSEPLWVSL